jgi:trimeric autotransporter adhesin
MRLSSCRVPLSLGLLALSPLIGLTGCMNRSLTAIEIAPAVNTANIAVGQTAQFTATGIYTESGHQTTTVDMTSQVTWTSSITGVATVNSSGLASGVGAGTSTITASTQGAYGPLSASSNVTVTGSSSSGGSGSGGTATRTLSTVNVIPGSQTLAATGQTSQYLAIGVYSESPTSANLTTTSTWQSSDTSVATVSGTGLVTAAGVGTATITALATGPDGSVVGGTGTVTVLSTETARDMTALNVSPGTQAITSTGQTAQLIAIGVFNSSPVSVNLTNTVQWQSSDAQVATVNSSGLVTGVGLGSATITALATAPDGSTFTASSGVTVTSASSGRILTSLSLVPTTQTVGAVGETAQFLAIGTYSAAPLTADLTSQVTWISSDTDVGTINSTGLATTVGTGTSSITALIALPDTSVVSASGTLTWPQNEVDSGSPTAPALAVYNLGTGGGTVAGPNSISCVSTAGVTSATSNCTANFTLGQVVTLVATPDGTSQFDGWSSNCTPVTSSAPGTYSCTITMNNNESVGAIFDPQ